jgi:hypothetical protein
MSSEAQTSYRPCAEPIVKSTDADVAWLRAQLEGAQKQLALEREVHQMERAAHSAQYQEVLGLLSGYEAARLASPEAAIDTSTPGPVSKLIQSLHATINIQRQALGDDMSGVYYARVVEAAHAYWDLQTEYGRDFQVAPGPSQTDNPFLGTPRVADKGPWSLFYGQDGRLVGVLSEDFTRDVLLRVEGDFADEADRLAYTRWVRDALIRACDRTTSSLLETCVRSLHSCYQEFTSICDAAKPAIDLLQGYVDLLDAHLSQGAPADSPLHDDRRILAEAVVTLGGVVGRASECAASRPPD